MFFGVNVYYLECGLPRPPEGVSLLPALPLSAPMLQERVRILTMKTPLFLRALLSGFFALLFAIPALAGVDDDSTKTKNKELPLEAGSTLAFTTDEGSWISLDVSPDGNTLVFDLLGDLYTLPFEGGKAERLTSGMHFDSQPRFSPDGKKIVYVSDYSGGDNLWTIDLENKKTHQITKGKGNQYVSPEWAPDGKYIIASKGETRLGVVKLWMGHVDGGSGKVLIEKPDNLKTVGASFSPDGRYIWHARRQGSWQYNAIFPQYQVAMYDRETGESYTRTSRYGSAFRPVVSPDGKWLVYGSRDEDQTGLRIRDLGSGDEEWLAYPIQRDDKESIADRDVLPGMTFTPDSKEVVVSYGGKIWRVPIDGTDPISVPFEADVELEIGPRVDFDYEISDEAEFTVRQIRDAVPSPDGSRLAFTALDRLYVMDYPDGDPDRLTEMDLTEAQPVWSPDGNWIAYVTWSEDGGHLHKVRADGRGEPQRLSTQTAIYQQPAWSPDGERIVAVRGPAKAYQDATGPFAAGAATDLTWIPSAGGAAQLIAPTDGRTTPHFTGNAERIYLHHGEKGLVSIRWDGTDEKQHVKVTGNKRPGTTNPNAASVIRMAPAGDQALALVNHDIYVVTVPMLGGETPAISVANPENAPFPAHKLTDIGGQFPAWSADGRKVHWSIGNAHLIYDLDRAKAVADSIAAAKEEEAADDETEEDQSEEGDAEGGGEEGADAEVEKKEEGYKAAEKRILVSARRDIPEGAVVLTGARIITMDGGEVIESGDVLIRNNRIEAVGSSGAVEVPEGARKIDVSGKTIVPGYVDTHAHMWPTWNIHKPQIWMYTANLAYGVTTTRDPQTSSTDVITYGDLVDAGKMLGPRVYSTGPGVFGDYITDPLRDLDHARDVMKRYSEYYDTKTIKMYMAGNRQQRQWVIMAAREQGLMPTTEGGLRLKYNLTMMVDGYPGQEHSFPVYPLYNDVVQLAAHTQMAYTPTLLVSYGGPFGENYFYTRENPHDDEKLRRFTPHSEIDAKTRRQGAGVGPGPGGWFREEEYVFEDHAQVAKTLVEAGGRVGIGSHGQLQGLGYHWELWAVASGGMSEHDALRAATIFGAEAIGLEKELGSVQAGKLADLVILNANPLDDIRNTNAIYAVMKNGRLYNGDTLDEIWPEERMAELPVQEDSPAGVRAGVRKEGR